MFLCLLSYLVLFVKPSLLVINDEMTISVENDTCLRDDLFCQLKDAPKESWSILQIITNFWVFMFALEEFRQVKSKKRIFLNQYFFSVNR